MIFWSYKDRIELKFTCNYSKQQIEDWKQDLLEWFLKKNIEDHLRYKQK